MYVQQERSIVEIAKRGNTITKCAAYQKEFNVNKTSSSAEDNWDDKIQSINNKKKGDYIYITLLVNNAPIKFLIDRGSLVTLVPQRLFNITRVEKVNTNYKDVNDNKAEFVGQTTATVKTNKTTLQLPLLITKAKITLLMRLDWMKRLQRTISANTEEIKNHNIKVDESEKKLNCRTNSTICSTKTTNKRSGGKSKSEGRCKQHTTKGTNDTNSPTR